MCNQRCLMYFLSSYLFKFIANGSEFGMLMWCIYENQGYRGFIDLQDYDDV